MTPEILNNVAYFLIWSGLFKVVKTSGLLTFINTSILFIRFYLASGLTDNFIPCHLINDIFAQGAMFWLSELIFSKESFKILDYIHHIVSISLMIFVNTCIPVLYNSFFLLEASTIFYSLKRTKIVPQSIIDPIFFAVFVICRIFILIPYFLMNMQTYTEFGSFIFFTSLNLYWTKMMIEIVMKRVVKE